MALSVQTPRNQTNGLLDSLSAFLFPGQGSQEVGMGRDLYESSPAARRIFDDADKALGTSLTQIMFDGPAEELDRTVNSQAAIFAVSLACLAATNEQIEQTLGGDAHARFIAGHSLGEYTALVAGGVLDPAEAIWLVRERGRLMQEACEQSQGTMAAILGLPEATVEMVCRETGVQIANINSPGQIVISGEESAVAKARELASTRGAKRTIPLRVSGAFHSYLMEPALNGMMKALEGVHFRNPVTPIIANCSGKPLTSSSDAKEELVQQLCGCVLWQDSINYMINAGVTNFIEFGPGRVLSGLVKRIADNANTLCVTDLKSAQDIANGSSEVM